MLERKMRLFSAFVAYLFANIWNMQSFYFANFLIRWPRTFCSYVNVIVMWILLFCIALCMAYFLVVSNLVVCKFSFFDRDRSTFRISWKQFVKIILRKMRCKRILYLIFFNEIWLEGTEEAGIWWGMRCVESWSPALYDASWVREANALF